MTPIKINENWTVSKDSFQWVLTYEAEGELNPETGKHKKTTRTTYHSTLEQVLRHFTDSSLEGNSIQDLQQSLLETRKYIEDFCARVNR